MTLGELVRAYRTEHAMNMQDFADHCGLSKAYISILERNINPSTGRPPIPSLETIRSIAKTIHMDFNDIIAALDGDQIVSLEASHTLPSSTISIDPSKWHQIPILGRISAGLPLYAEEHIEGYTLTDLNGGTEYFALRVHGDSMNAIGINDGYLIIVRRQEEVENGEVAVVMVGDNDATVKRFYAAGDTVTLLPQSTNPSHDPQIYNLKNTKIKVLGKVIEVKFAL